MYKSVLSGTDGVPLDEIYSLREAKQNAQVAGAEREGMKKRISEMQQFLDEQQQDITEYDEQLVRRLIEKITVYDERVTVEFKSGTSVDVRRFMKCTLQQCRVFFCYRKFICTSRAGLVFLRIICYNKLSYLC